MIDICGHNILHTTPITIHERFIKLINKILEEIIMSSYENLVKEENEDLYFLIRPFIHLLPDRRPMDTIKKMKTTLIDGEETLEAQDNWHIIYDEIVAMTSVGRERDKQLIELLISGPVDHDSICNSLDYADFFDIYEGFSHLLPYISSCIENIEDFYISRGKYDLLPFFRPAVHHLHAVRDEETFNRIYDKVKEDLYFTENYTSHTHIIGSENYTSYTHKIINIALKRSSYGLLLAISRKFNIKIGSMRQIIELTFSPDLLPSLHPHILWKHQNPFFISSSTNVDTLKLVLEKKYVDPSTWSLEDILSLSYAMCITILVSLPEILCFTTKNVAFLLFSLLAKDSSSPSPSPSSASACLKDIIERIKCYEDVTHLTLLTEIYRLCANARLSEDKRDEIVQNIIQYGSILCGDSLLPCLDLFVSKNYTEGIESILKDVEGTEEFSDLPFSKGIVSYLVKNYEVLLIRLLNKGLSWPLEYITRVAMKEKSEKILDFIKGHDKVLHYDEFLIATEVLEKPLKLEDMLFFLKRSSVEEIKRNAAWALDIITKQRKMNNEEYCATIMSILRVSYDKMGYSDLLSKIEVFPKEDFFRLVMTPMFLSKNTSILDELFYEACRLNLPQAVSILDIDPTIGNFAGLFLSLEYDATDMFLRLISDARVVSNQIHDRLLSLAITKGNDRAVYALLHSPFFDAKSLLIHTPIYLYDSKKAMYHDIIANLLKEVPDLARLSLLKICY